MVSNSGVGSDAGRVLNERYQLINLVGGGGMAQVYKARDNVLGRVVAVKVLREQYANDEQFVARFKREAQAAANLAHPNIVNVYDVGQDGDVYFIVMEFISGESLKELITRSAPLPTDTAVSIAAQILAGLEYAHRSGLIHRDIKPQNVVLTREGAVKVTDFGIAKSVSDLGLTEAGLALGTAHYFSPEQAKGERVVPQSDIYAVGVSLYEMLTGHIPFESDTAVGLAYKHISEIPRPPSQQNPNVPARLDTIVMKAMAKEPAQRYNSAAEMEKALRNLQASGQQATAAIPIPIPAARTNITSGGPRQTSGRTTRAGRQAVGGQPTTPVPPGGSRGYPAAAGATVAGATTRHVASPLAAPSSVAMRPSPARVQSGGTGCTAAGVALVLVGLAAIIVAGAIFAGGPIRDFFNNSPVVQSPTNTPVVPTATRTPTRPPPTVTPTGTPTISPTPTQTPVTVKVPNLIGLQVADAKKLLDQVGFVLLEDPRVITTDWAEGVVFQQDPPPDSLLQKTNIVRVRVSAGPPPFKLPPVTNSAPEDAKAALESAGLKVEFVNEGSLNIPKGLVTRSEPPADASVRPGDTIKVFISLGETVSAPDLKGLTPDLAQQRLAPLGLTVGAISEVGRTEVGNDIDSVPDGTVYDQEPKAGAPVSKGGSVNVRIRRRE